VTEEYYAVLIFLFAFFFNKHVMAIKEKIEVSFVTIATFLWLVHIMTVEKYGGNPRIHQIYLTVITFSSQK
jgi:hypothetical protein